MPSRRQIREAVVQFLYCADLEGGADPAALRDPFWDFVTETDLRNLRLATFRTVHHLAHGRDGRLAEFVERQTAAITLLAAWPQAEPLKLGLSRIAELESVWSSALASLERLPKDDDDASVAASFRHGTRRVFPDRPRVGGGPRRGFSKTSRISPPCAGRWKPSRRRSAACSVCRSACAWWRNRKNSPTRRISSASANPRPRSTPSAAAPTNWSTRSSLTRRPSMPPWPPWWTTTAPDRIDPVDRAILRLATHEILHAATPPKVAINEAIELAKRFGTRTPSASSTACWTASPNWRRRTRQSRGVL